MADDVCWGGWWQFSSLNKNESSNQQQVGIVISAIQINQ